MKERLYLTPDGRTRLEVCDCEGQLQLRMFRPEHSPIGYSRVLLNRADLDRLADFFNDMLVDIEDWEAKGAKLADLPENWEALPEAGSESESKR